VTVRGRLRELLEQPDVIVVPGAADAITARVIEEVGFPAVYVTGAGFANASFGVPDIGLVSLPDVVAHVQRITDVVQVPVVVDADTGYGGVLNAYRTVRLLEQVGVAAIQLEDQLAPKRCGHLDGQVVVPPAQMVERLAAALDARQDPDLLIVARTDARESEGFAGVVQRAQIYAEAGADLIFAEALQTREELEKLPGLVSVPLVANMVEGGKTPLLTAGELQELGFRVALFANTALRSAVHAVQHAMAVLHRDGGTQTLLADMLPWDERQRLIGLPEAQERESRYVDASQQIMDSFARRHGENVVDGR
jgi:2,3-dimethylmalate lyase